jgi:hypothetical protein
MTPLGCTAFARFTRIMRNVTLPLPMMGFVIVTRAALAAGLALMFADRIPERRRRAVGAALAAVGAATTVPIVSWLFRRRRTVPANVGVESDPALVGTTRFPRKGDEPL